MRVRWESRKDGYWVYKRAKFWPGQETDMSAKDSEEAIRRGWASEALVKAAPKPSPVPEVSSRKRGRPFGSKNKPAWK